MPEMGGRALREEVGKIRPGVPAVFMSGYPDRDGGGTPHDLLPGDFAIGKPFKRAGLLATIRETLEGARETNA
jgi:FixJ family two-component response regulator